MKRAWKMPGIGQKPRWVIVDENDKIINKSPSKEELKGLHVSSLKGHGRSGDYNETNTCDRCGKHFSKVGWGNPRREYDKNGNPTGRWVCLVCHYALKSKRRTGDQDPNHSNVKGDKYQKLACLEFGWKDLNKENDNYIFPIDCLDPKTGLFHQIKGRWYDPIERCWRFGNLEREQFKKYEDMICYCISKDGKRIERIYVIPFLEINGRICISIIKNPTNNVGVPIIPWYEKYRVIDEKELKKANEIWKEIDNVII